MAAPLVWAKLLTVFDLLRFFGVMQIVVWRMLKVGSRSVCVNRDEANTEPYRNRPSFASCSSSLRSDSDKL